jgi:hypothetical protein
VNVETLTKRVDVDVARDGDIDGEVAVNGCPELNSLRRANTARHARREPLPTAWPQIAPAGTDAISPRSKRKVRRGLRPPWDAVLEGGVT